MRVFLILKRVLFNVVSLTFAMIHLGLACYFFFYNHRLKSGEFEWGWVSEPFVGQLLYLLDAPSYSISLVCSALFLTRPPNEFENFTDISILFQNNLEIIFFVLFSSIQWVLIGSLLRKLRISTLRD